MKKHTIIKYILSIMILLIMIAIISNPARYIKSSSNGLMVWAINVLPVLFPFMFLSKALTELGAVKKVSLFTHKATTKIFNVGKASGFIYLMSIISGYPIGAKLISEYSKNGMFNKIEATRLTSFCTTSGVLFVIGTVGMSLFNNVFLGIIIFISHILGAFINGFLFSFYKKKEYCEKKFALPSLRINVKADNILSNVIHNSVLSIAVVGGYICLFYIFIDIANDFSILSPLNFFIGKFLELFNIPAHASSGVTNGLIEITRGIVDLSQMGLQLHVVSTIICFIISFGGLSIAIQSLTFLMDCKVSPLIYFISKFSHAIISSILCLPLSLIFL